MSEIQYQLIAVKGGKIVAAVDADPLAEACQELQGSATISELAVETFDDLDYKVEKL